MRDVKVEIGPGATPATWPALIGLGHLVALGLAPSEDAARKWLNARPQLRAPGVGRRVLVLRDALLRHVGLDGQGVTEAGGSS